MPQWNCVCPNCREARLGRIPARTQSSVAVGDEHGRWFLINASPDLRSQIEAFPDLQPGPQSPRNSPIAGVLLTNADLDHVLGLFSLREGERLDIWATSAVRDILARGLGLDGILDSFCGAGWHEPATAKFSPLGDSEGGKGSLLYRAIVLPGGPPPFAKGLSRDGTHSTFWSRDELRRVKSTAPKADEMGHVTIKDDSLELLGKIGARQKIYIHINNTNPVLARQSPERTAVESAGIVVGYDGLEFDL